MWQGEVPNRRCNAKPRGGLDPFLSIKNITKNMNIFQSYFIKTFWKKCNSQYPCETSQMYWGRYATSLCIYGHLGSRMLVLTAIGGAFVTLECLFLATRMRIDFIRIHFKNKLFSTKSCKKLHFLTQKTYFWWVFLCLMHVVFAKWKVGTFTCS